MIVGLTGNIGSGKSTVSHRLSELGAEVIDTDLVSRQVVATGTPGLKKIVEEFGPGVLSATGELDRGRMAAIVFDSPQARARLEGIMHPEVFRVVGQRIAEYQGGCGKAPVLVVEVPLLIESGMHSVMDEVWLVTVDHEEQLKRVMARSGLSREDVEKRIKAQMKQEDKCRYAHRIIDNSGSMEMTLRQVDAIWNEISLNIHSKSPNP